MTICIIPKSYPLIDKDRQIKIKKKAKSSLPIKQSSNVTLETRILNENSEDDQFSIYQLLNSNPVFITIADHTLPIDIDFGALISLLNWKAFQTVNPKSNISLLSTKSKFKMVFS